jgi:hypothetical protein
LILGVSNRVPCELVGRLASQRERDEFLAGTVLLIRRAIAALFLIAARSRRELELVANRLTPARREPAVTAPGCDVDRAAAFGRHERKSVGGKCAGVDVEFSALSWLSMRKLDAPSAEVPDGRERVRGAPGGNSAWAEHLNHAAEGGVSPCAGTAARHDLDAS